MDNQPPIASIWPPSLHQDNIPIARVILHVGEGIFLGLFWGISSRLFWSNQHVDNQLSIALLGHQVSIRKIFRLQE
jgi:hypothetical protein